MQSPDLPSASQEFSTFLPAGVTSLGCFLSPVGNSSVCHCHMSLGPVTSLFPDPFTPEPFTSDAKNIVDLGVDVARNRQAPDID